MSEPTQQTATNNAAVATTAAPAPKKARVNMTQIMQAGNWLKDNAGKYIKAGLSSGCVARVASKALGFELTKQQVENIAAGAGVAFPDIKPTERIAKLEDMVVELSRQNAELRGQPSNQAAPKAA